MWNGRQSADVEELLAGLADEPPALPCVVPLAFLDDEKLPRALAPVEPAAFALACAESLWGPHGARN